MTMLFAPACALWVCRSTGSSSKRVRMPAFFKRLHSISRSTPFYNSSEGSEAGREWLIFDVGGARSLVRDTAFQGATFHSHC